ncbi:transposon Ty3-G Gag-Pol polyprotein [Trichonephila clavipes]|nr:transposon Ty3-G Gag-Pol polyprotein [Trichonephila clavipes]
MLTVMPLEQFLLLGEGSDEHPIEYASRLLTPAERNYSTQREALAVVWALKKFRVFQLESTVYIPGKANVVADMLSRPVSQEESFCENHITIADMPTRSCKDMRETQLKDDNLRKIIDSFESPLKTEEYAKLD